MWSLFQYSIYGQMSSVNKLVGGRCTATLNQRMRLWLMHNLLSLFSLLPRKYRWWFSSVCLKVRSDSLLSRFLAYSKKFSYRIRNSYETWSEFSLALSLTHSPRLWKLPTARTVMRSLWYLDGIVLFPSMKVYTGFDLPLT